jgi:hypothetical protein
VERPANLVIGRRWRRSGRANESGRRRRRRSGCGSGFGNRDGLGDRLGNGGCRCQPHLEAQAQPDLRRRDVGQRVARPLGDVRINKRELGAQLAVVDESWEPFGPTVRITSHGIPLLGANNRMDGSRRNGHAMIISEVPSI